MWLLILSVTILLIKQSFSLAPLNTKPFGDDFLVGVSTAAPSAEGAWDQDGKSEDIWNRVVKTNPEFITDRSSSDISANGYNLVEQDVEILNFLGVRHSRISLSWSRILPNGVSDYINMKAIDHYKKLFELYRENQIEPFVTLYYWDLPQSLQDLGGFRNESFVQWFKDYAKVCFEHFGQQVKFWSTFNDPLQICVGGYGYGYLAPALKDPGVGEYICGHNLLKAHAAAYHLYEKSFRDVQGGRISINLGSNWFEPKSDSKEDREASERQMEFVMGWFAHPIYWGNYPPKMVQRMRERSPDGPSRLPVFTKKEIDFVKGTHDYFSLNYQNTLYVESALTLPFLPRSFESDAGVRITDVEGDDTFGIKKLLVWIKQHYNNPSIIITENSYGTPNRNLEDSDRIEYIKRVLSNVKDAIDYQHVRCYGYTYKSPHDSWEWTEGYRGDGCVISRRWQPDDQCPHILVPEFRLRYKNVSINNVSN
ncbi:myrosinase 1 isoform X2 [Leptinotarsa decemlineata]|uniref:myrosinase 1 isoform X2 n=1 Tax=Leptinotarsa decemlineata TaxID=7539 RepID=UPI003D30D227